MIVPYVFTFFLFVIKDFQFINNLGVAKDLVSYT